MKIIIRCYEPKDVTATMSIWNEVVRDGIAFPQVEELTLGTSDDFFRSHSYTGVAEDTETGEVVGLYILHPNNIGRCGHICNTSYAVRSDKRGLHIGEQLVKDSLTVGARMGFRVLQFNAVVASTFTLCIFTNVLVLYSLAEYPRVFA